MASKAVLKSHVYSQALFSMDDPMVVRDTLNLRTNQQAGNKTRPFLCCHPVSTSKSTQYPQMSFSDYTRASAWYVSALPHLRTPHIAKCQSIYLYVKTSSRSYFASHQVHTGETLVNLMVILLVDVSGMCAPGQPNIILGFSLNWRRKA